jgi:hypothetical protein
LGDVRVFRASPDFLRDILREVVETFGDFQVFSHKITEAAFSASLKCGAIEKYTHSVQFSFFSFKETFYEYIEQKRNFAFVFNALIGSASTLTVSAQYSSYVPQTWYQNG